MRVGFSASRSSALLLAAMMGWIDPSGCMRSLSAAPTEQDAVAKVDACTLLKSAEIQQALQRPVETPQRKDPGYVSEGAYSSVCVWTIPVGASAAGGQSLAAPDDAAPMGGRQFVILNVIRWPTGKGMARKFLDAFYSAAERGEIPHTPVARRLGDDALWWGDGLAVRRGDLSFGISIFIPRTSLEEAERIEEILARRVLARLDPVAPPVH